MELIILLIALILSAFFSGMEMALISSNKLKIEIEKKNNKLTSKIIGLFVNNSSQFITTMLIANNITMVIYSIASAKFLEPYIQNFTDSNGLIILFQILISTSIILFFGEFLPKAIFRTNANLLLNIFAIPTLILYSVLWIFSKSAIIISSIFFKIFFKTKIKNNNETIFNKIDIDHFIKQNTDNQSKDVDEYVKIFQNALQFANVKLKTCITPRTEIEAIAINSSIEQLKEQFIETGYSKILIYKESIDNIIGYVHSSDIFKNPKSIKSILINIPVVPLTMNANKMLKIFIKERKSLAVVVDEFGGTEGIVTIEDVMEEIFGNIEDEHDKIIMKEKQINKDEYMFSARLEIDYINEKYKLNIPESSDYETLAGYILFNYNNVPKNNEEIVIGNFNITILKAEKNRIELINIKRID